MIILNSRASIFQLQEQFSQRTSRYGLSVKSLISVLHSKNTAWCVIVHYFYNSSVQYISTADKRYIGFENTGKAARPPIITLGTRMHDTCQPDDT